MWKKYFAGLQILLMSIILLNYGAISQDTIDSLHITNNNSIELILEDSVLIPAEEKPLVNPIDLSNKIYQPNIKTVLLHRNGWDLSPPLLKFNSGEKLKLSFDDLDGDVKDYQYSIVHCDAQWKKSDLEQYEYIDGYFEDYIDDYEYSFNTIQAYTHYELIFPTDDLAPAKSGNYIMEVFIENPDSLIFTHRFMVVDQKVSLNAVVNQASNISERNYKQEIEFEITTQSYRIINPYRDLKIVVMQNGRWDNKLCNLKPKMVIGDKLKYHNEVENIFDGGNEFRSFTIKNLNYNSEEIFKIEFNYQGYHAYLLEDKRQTFKVYKSRDDINGQQKITADSRSNANTEAEYVNTHFFLPYPVPMIDGYIHIIGALTDWSYSEESKMDYNYKRKGYEKTLYLKQGYYNYQYIFLRSDKSVGDVSFIEGNHWETGNVYTIFVYYREPGEYYDKLIGVKHVSSLIE